jgi:hypothetical protein
LFKVTATRLANLMFMGVPRSNCAVSKVCGKILVMGGFRDDGTTTALLILGPATKAMDKMPGMATYKAFNTLQHVIAAIASIQRYFGVPNII